MRLRKINNGFSQFQHRAFNRIAEIHRAVKIVRAAHQLIEPIDQIVHIAKRARLFAVAVDRDRLVRQRLHNEVGYNAPIIRMHARAVSIENARDLYTHFVLSPIIHKKRFGAALAFVVTGADANRVNVSVIILDLRMDFGIAVHFAGRGLQDFCLYALGKAKHVDRTVHAGFGRLYRIKLIVHRGGRAGEVVDFIDFDIQRESDVVPQQFKIRMQGQMADIAFAAGIKIIGA